MEAIAFSRDQRILVSATGGPPWEATGTLWDLTDQARPRLLRRVATAPLVSDNPGPLPHGVSQADLVFSPDGHTLASVSGRDQVTVWNLTRPDRATRIATLAGPVLVTTRPGLLASARFPGGGRAPAIPCGCGADAYAVAFTPDGHALTAVIARPETSPSAAARDTVFTWQVTGSGALGDLTTVFRDVSDAQPTLPAGGRIVADGSVTGGKVHLWTPP